MSEGSANLKAEHVMIYIIANNYCSSLGIGEVNWQIMWYVHDSLHCPGSYWPVQNS